MEASPMYYPQSQAQDQLQYVGVGRRFLAILIDTILLGIIEGIFIFLFGFAVGSTQATGLGSLVGFIIAVAYFFGLEAIQGATLGKRILGIRVVKTDGSPIGWSESIIRNLLRIVDGLFGYLVGAILVWTSPQRQRLGDRLAKTVVIRR